MDHKDTRGSEKRLLQHIGNSSKHMVYNHHLDNLSEFLVHDLCSDQGFGLRKAAYLLSNPDFECLKGITGYHQNEAFGKGVSWQMPQEFTSHMRQSEFNQKVRSYMNPGVKSLTDNTIEEVVHFFQIDHPVYHVWNGKHNNQGLFIFEQSDIAEPEIQEHLYHFLHMLSFCPIF